MCKNYLTRSSVTQAGLIDEKKNKGLKICETVPLNKKRPKNYILGSKNRGHKLPNLSFSGKQQAIV
jgi:hypothetical protein